MPSPGSPVLPGPPPDNSLLSWSAKQGYILTGGGVLGAFCIPGRDYRDPEDLPHFHLRRGRNELWQTFGDWRLGGRASAVLAGAWKRPAFAGGFLEDYESDTKVFNLQTPSLFIDIRCPLARPQLAARGCLTACSDLELRQLARQHCFAGYTLPEPPSVVAVADWVEPPIVFTRHHAIDWNFHPSHPRPRPNRWSAEVSPDRSSFKELSVARDALGTPVYYERWHRLAGDLEGEKHFAMRRQGGSVDAVLIVVGDHFAFARDRPQPVPAFEGATGPGGPPLIDAALANGDRASAEAYLDLEGSYGRTAVAVSTGESVQWRIEHSTHPWREGCVLLVPGELRLSLSAVEDGQRYGSASWAAEAWEVCECSFSDSELDGLFGDGCRIDVPLSRM